MALANGDDFEPFLVSGIIEHVAKNSNHAPAFAIPIVRSSFSSNARYVQKVDRENNISLFSSTEINRNLFPVEEPRHIAVGEPEVFGVIDPSGFVKIGTQAELAGDILDWLPRVGSLAQRLNFARFVHRSGAADASELMYKTARAVFRHNQGKAKSERYALSWLLHTIVYQDLVEIYKGVAESEIEFGDIVESLVSVSGSITKEVVNLSIPEELSTYHERLSVSKHSDLDQIMHLLMRASGRKSGTISHPDKPSSKQNRLELSAVDDAVSRLMSLGRQEDRLAVALAYLLDGGLQGRRIFDAYDDHALFARRVKSRVSSMLDSMGTTWGVDDLIAMSIPEIVSSAHPYQRGRVLLSLSQRFASNRGVANQVRSILDRSRSKYVDEVRGQILRYLNA